MFNLNSTELKIFKKLCTPIKIQDYLDTIPINFGETHYSPRIMLHEMVAHCFEGALLAAAVLWYHGHEPLLLDLKAHPHDDDHVVALYRINGYWGAISKTNHATVRFRDPVYKTIRELALSYFHEYFLNKNGKKVLWSYSKPFNLKKFGTDWVTSEVDLEYLADKLDASSHLPLYPSINKRYIRKADAMERKAGALLEWRRKY